MRLIDADALINELYDFEHEHTYVNDDGDLIVFNVPTWVDWLISVAPTAEAIPIEWLKQFVYTKPDVIEHLIVLWRREREQGDDNYTENNSFL